MTYIKMEHKYRDFIKLVNLEGSISIQEASTKLKIREINVKCLANRSYNENYISKKTLPRGIIILSPRKKISEFI